MAQRDVRQRYAGASLGTWWAVVNPLVFVGAYTLLFTVIFRARLTPDAPPSAYAMYVVSGLLPWVAFAEVATRATQTVAEHRGLIKYTMFPAELLPLTSIFGAVASQCIGFILVVLINILLTGEIKVNIILLFLFLILQIMFLAGVAWMLASFGALLRDVRELIPIALTAGMFLTPIFYDPSNLPEVVRTIIVFNPMVPLLRVFRAAIIGTPADLVSLGFFSIISFVLCISGFAIFIRVRGELADTL
jgi:lipopolysaccharide transport system permease protein